MAKAESTQTINNADGTLSIEHGLTKVDDNTRVGGWATFPFLIGSAFTQTLATNGVVPNLVVFLIRKFNIPRIDAAQIANIIIGCINISPIVGAIAADSFFGSFPVIASCSFVCFLGLILLTLTATLPSLQPPSCAYGIEKCVGPSKAQLTALFMGLVLVTVGNGGTRYTYATFGAIQFKNANDRETFINWFIFAISWGCLAGASLVVYVQDNVGWGWGYGLCGMATAIGVVLFLLGRQRYRHMKVQGSPFTCMARVLVASIRKRKAILTSIEEDHYYHGKDTGCVKKQTPSKHYSFFNRAALMVPGDSETKPWRLCTVEQVEDLKTLVKLFPLWSTSFLVNTPFAIFTNLSVLQALSMDRHLGPHFAIPAGSFLVFLLLSSTTTIFLLDRFLYPACRKLISWQPTLLQKIGAGHVFAITGMAAFALVEARRLAAIHEHGLSEQPHTTIPVSALWLVVPLTLMGMSEAFILPGNAGFYYQEFPASLRSTATAMNTMMFGVAFYLSAVIIDVFRNIGWLPENINQARLDNVYWVIAGLGFVNFGFYLVLAWFYQYKETETD